MCASSPFPIVRGGCNCTLIRYQLEAAPLFCYACHCIECQKSSGSAFAPSATIEFDRVRIISKTLPKMINIEAHRHTRTIATCPNCHCVLWDCGSWRPSTYNVHVGTLDFPGLFEPDLHIYLEGKVQWLTLPEGTKTLPRDMDQTKCWPKSSLVRFEACLKRWEARKREDEAREGKALGDEGGDKTPTNGSPEPGDDGEGEVEDADFERRQDEIERALEERLEKLCLKLDQEETKSKS